MDCAGKGNSSWFWYMEHMQLSSIIELELTDNVCMFGQRVSCATGSAAFR